jgi:para-aminobenzoate synthetase/4-amino-4-deoxychorismate lyase
MVCELDGPTPILKRSKTDVTKTLSPDPAADGPPIRFWQAGKPFVLLDFPGGARLYRGAREVVEARSADEVRPALEQLRGCEAAGFLGYEAGHPLERKLAPVVRDAGDGEPPLLWFGLFDAWEPVDVEALPEPAGAWAGRPEPLIEAADYLAQAERVREHILAGDVYQINLTFPAEVTVAGHPLALYRAL